MQPPKTVEAFDKTLKRLQGGNHVAYFVCTEGGALAGVIDISEICTAPDFLDRVNPP